jgi:hypothetical protein
MISHFAIFILPYLEGLEQRGELWLLWGFLLFHFSDTIILPDGISVNLFKFHQLIAAVNVIIVIIIYILFFSKTVPISR